MVASESCIKGSSVDKGPCVPSIIVLRASPSDWFLIDLELTHGNGILPGLSTHFHIHKVVKYIELLVNSKASEQEQGETQMGGKSTRHHIVAAWRTSMGRNHCCLSSLLLLLLPLQIYAMLMPRGCNYADVS